MLHNDQLDCMTELEQLMKNAGARKLHTNHWTVMEMRRSQLYVLGLAVSGTDRKSTRLNSSHLVISYAVFCLKKKKTKTKQKNYIQLSTTRDKYVTNKTTD